MSDVARGGGLGIRGAGVRELALVLLTFLLLAVLLELGARLVLPATRYHDSALVFDPVLGFRGEANARIPVETPEGVHELALGPEGFRGRALPDGPPAPGVTRIAWLGDSFLVGLQVREDELMTSRLEASLRARGSRAEVYNLGVTDYGTAQQLMLLDRLAPRLQPEVVVLAFYVGNDIVNNSLLLARETEVSPGDPIRPYLVPEGPGGNGVALRKTWLQPGRARLRSVSRLFTFFERRALAASMEALGNPNESASHRLRQGWAPRAHLEVFRMHGPRHRWERAWQTSFALLRAVRERCRRLGAELLVLVIPDVHQVEHAALDVRYGVEARHFARRSLDRLLDWNLPERRLADFLAAEGIAARLLLPSLRAAAREGVVYTVDKHLNARGHEIAAGLVEEWLDSRAPAVGEPPAGAPVHVLRLHGGDPAWLDFAEGRHDLALGAGWLRWSELPEGAGWLTGPGALVALRARPGALVVRGRVPEGARLPIEGQLAIVTNGALPFRIEKPGRFELRWGWQPERGGLDEDGYAAVIIRPGVTQLVDGLPVGLAITEVGFEPRP